MSKSELQNIIKAINNLWFEKYSNTFTDIADKSVLYEFAKNIKLIDGIDDVILGEREVVKYIDFDKETGFLYKHALTILIKNIKLSGQINLIEKSGNDYNIVLCLNTNHILKESFNLNENLDFKSFIKELKNCKSFEDIKHVVKKYVAEGIMLGTLLTAILCNFSLSDSQYHELCDPNIVYSENFYVYDEPEWELLCNDTEATVYHAKPQQCNKDVQNTASMFKLNLKDPESHKIIAMERTMMKEYGLKYGDLVKIEGTGSRDGVYQIQDTMNKRFAGKHKIDILINNDSAIGKWNNIKIYKLLNPKESYDILKLDMADALNQSQINARQIKW